MVDDILSADRDLLKEQLEGLQPEKEGLSKAIQTITAPLNPELAESITNDFWKYPKKQQKVGAYQKL